MKDVASDILDKFVAIAQVQVFDELKKNQTRLAWCKEVAETKKYKELDAKMAALLSPLRILKEEIATKDSVLVTLRKIKAHQLSHHVDLEDLVIKADFDMLKERLEPYRRLLAPLEEIRMMHSSLLSQAKLKKLTLPYDEINEALKHIAASLALMAEKLEAIITFAMRSLEKVA